MANEVEALLHDASPLVVIDLQGDVTSFADETISGAYRQASEQGARHILLNFAGVDYINSAGISTVIGILTEAQQAEQALLITGLTAHYQKIFQMMGLLAMPRSSTRKTPPANLWTDERLAEAKGPLADSPEAIRAIYRGCWMTGVNTTAVGVVVA